MRQSLIQALIGTGIGFALLVPSLGTHIDLAEHGGLANERWPVFEQARHADRDSHVDQAGRGSYRVCVTCLLRNQTASQLTDHQTSTVTRSTDRSVAGTQIREALHRFNPRCPLRGPPQR